MTSVLNEREHVSTRSAGRGDRATKSTRRERLRKASEGLAEDGWRARAVASLGLSQPEQSPMGPVRPVRALESVSETVRNNTEGALA